MTDERPSAPDLERALADYLDAQRMTRRQLLERIAAVGAGAALAPVIAAFGTGAAADGLPAQHRGVAAPPPAARVVPAVPVLPVAPIAPAAAAGTVSAAPVQAAAASSHVVARIIARLVSRG